MLAIRRWNALAPAEQATILARSTAAIFDDEIHAGVAAILADVCANGDEAVARALATSDGVEVGPGGLSVAEEEFAEAGTAVSAELLDAIRVGITNKRRYNERVLRDASWSEELMPGVRPGEVSSPIASARLFVSSGKGPFPSVLMQIGTPAVVAGVARVAVVVPPIRGAGAKVDPAVLVVADELRLRDAFRVNGPAGIAAHAFGTESIPKVGRIVDPGSPAVAAAHIQVQRYGCSCVMLFGPSESIIIADESSDLLLVAANLLNEAEHGADSASLLVTPSERLVDEVAAHVETMLEEPPQPPARLHRLRDLALRRRDPRRRSRPGGRLRERVRARAPARRHGEAAGAVPRPARRRRDAAGDTPIVAVNLPMGVPATLPTGGFARYSSGVTARTFTKTSSVAETSPEAIERLGPSILAIADHEGFPAHARSIHLRRAGATDAATSRAGA